MHAPLQLKTDYINVLLDLASSRTRDRGSRVYEIELGLSIRDVRLLRMIGGAPGITMGQLVQTCAIEKTLVSKLVASLVQRELVQRQIGNEDARQIHLCLTQAGIDLVLEDSVQLGAESVVCATPLIHLLDRQVDAFEDLLGAALDVDGDLKPFDYQC